MGLTAGVLEVAEDNTYRGGGVREIEYFFRKWGGRYSRERKGEGRLYVFY